MKNKFSIQLQKTEKKLNKAILAKLKKRFGKKLDKEVEQLRIEAFEEIEGFERSFLIDNGKQQEFYKKKLMQFAGLMFLSALIFVIAFSIIIKSNLRNHQEEYYRDQVERMELYITELENKLDSLAFNSTEMLLQKAESEMESEEFKTFLANTIQTYTDEIAKPIVMNQTKQYINQSELRLDTLIDSIRKTQGTY